jgi:hypothetical protein
MAARTGRRRVSKRHSVRHQSLFDSMEFHGRGVGNPNAPCNVVAVAKRRDGGTRYWCLIHRADATAKYGKRARKCRAADEPPLRLDDMLTLNLNKYLGGVALWGAVPAVYDTTRLPMDRGIHVHARATPGAKKETDWTYRAVRILGDALPKGGIVVHEIDAIYYMVTSVFGYPMRYVTCTHCGWPHLDKDWFSVHPHQRHLCAGCGKHFRDSVTGIGNPIVGVRHACGAREHKTARSQRKLDIRQTDYPGGIQIWGSNPAFLWTSSRTEEEGIHVHAFLGGQEDPELDETYGEVTIDGARLDPEMVRVLMAQNVMPTLKDRIRSIDCPACRRPQFGVGEAAYNPTSTHTCSGCGHQFAVPGRLRNTVANPLLAILAGLAKMPPRQPQQHRIDLLPETI